MTSGVLCPDKHRSHLLTECHRQVTAKPGEPEPGLRFRSWSHSDERMSSARSLDTTKPRSPPLK